MKKPVLPFPGYKWRWASFQPTEGLNEPSVYWGVLRVLYRFQGEAPSSKDLADALNKVREDTHTHIDLARTPERNLLRNSGQYWKGTGLLEERHGLIELTEFGRKAAMGEITKTEFAITVVKTFTLPNPFIFSDSELRLWLEQGVEIKPLELILKLLSSLSRDHGRDRAFLTLNELIKIVIPLSGNMVSLETIQDALLLFREGKLDVRSWPDCAPAANDRRMANEFLLFLYYYGFCDMSRSKTRAETQFYLSQIASPEISQIDSLVSRKENLVHTVEENRGSELTSAIGASLIERNRITTTRLSRSGQPKFRRDILRAFRSTCLFTGEKMEDVLEAPHIIPVQYNGPDSVQNGLCLRTDIHTLFDCGHIRIQLDGNVLFSDAIRQSVSYARLPIRIELPSFISRNSIEWRLEYL